MDDTDSLASSSELSLEGERISLVPLTEADLVPLHEWFLGSDPERLTCRPFQRRTADELVDRFLASRDRKSQKIYAIRRRSDDQLLGRISWFDWNPRNRTVEIGFLLGSEFRRCGYAREAAGTLLKELFHLGRVNKVLAQCGEFNEAAIALLKSLGFEQYGRLRRHHRLGDTLYDDLLYGLLAEDFFAEKGNFRKPK